IDHVGIACHDLAAKIAFYESVFDLTVVSREANEEQGGREAMLRVAAAPAGRPGSSCSSRSHRVPRSAGSWPAGVRACITSGTEWRTSQRRSRPSAAVGCAWWTNGRDMARWAPPSPFAPGRCGRGADRTGPGPRHGANDFLDGYLT